MRPEDRQLAAFRRLLTDAHQGGQAKIDALVALTQRTLFLVPWPNEADGYRTLVNSTGVAALPVFTDLTQLTEAANRYGWLDAQRTARSVEVGARAALSYATQHDLAFVVVDITAEHALEIAREEYEPLMSAHARRDSSGPYAARGRVSSTMMRAVKPTPPHTPAAQVGSAPGIVAPSGSSPGIAAQPDPSPPANAVGNAGSAAVGASRGFDADVQATFGGGTSVTLAPWTDPPSDVLFDALTAVLRGYPEVEWACLVLAARGPTAPIPTVGVRVDTGFRQRVNEINNLVREAAQNKGGATVDILLLDQPDLMRNARATGIVFYPWRRK